MPTTLSILLTTLHFLQVDAHGRLYDPPSRSCLNSPFCDYPKSSSASKTVPLQCGKSLMDYCSHCRQGDGAGKPLPAISGAPGQGYDDFKKVPRYDHAEGFVCPSGDNPKQILHEWVPVKSCKPGKFLELSWEFTTAHGGIFRAFISQPRAKASTSTAYDDNTLLFDSVFAKSWTELEYVPMSDDKDAKYWFALQGKNGKQTGRFKLPSNLSEGHAFVMLQWATSNSYLPKKVVELEAYAPNLYSALIKQNIPHAETKCRDSSKCMKQSKDVNPIFQDVGDWLGEQFRALTDIKIDKGASSTACHAKSVVSRPFAGATIASGSSESDDDDNDESSSDEDAPESIVGSGEESDESSSEDSDIASPEESSSESEDQVDPNEVAEYGQCGGRGWSGPTTCEAGTKCIVDSEWYSQCKRVTDSDEDSQDEQSEDSPEDDESADQDSSEDSPEQSSENDSDVESEDSLNQDDGDSEDSDPADQNDGIAGAWEQCGGKNFNGPSNCEEGFTCEYGNPWYSQCKPAPDQPDSDSDDGQSTAQAWDQCGGKDYTGPTTCKTGCTCSKQSVWYSQCLPPSGKSTC